ncbi:hypothetical protein ACLOJK_039668 [Asimina triloba]
MQEVTNESGDATNQNLRSLTIFTRSLYKWIGKAKAPTSLFITALEVGICCKPLPIMMLSRLLFLCWILARIFVSHGRELAAAAAAPVADSKSIAIPRDYYDASAPTTAVGGPIIAEAPANYKEHVPVQHHLHRHRVTDRSVVGGYVILGGFATTSFGAIFCYIRITRSRRVEA